MPIVGSLCDLFYDDASLGEPKGRKQLPIQTSLQ
jgi:hypothetical protein